MELRNKRTWEYYEEPSKEITYIIPPVSEEDNGILIEFNTHEVAEKAAEKLKAWVRLKDKGFRFIDHIDRDDGQGITRYEWDGYVDGEDLDLLFGGEE